jgi:hypothetical protein
MGATAAVTASHLHSLRAIREELQRLERALCGGHQPISTASTHVSQSIADAFGFLPETPHTSTYTAGSRGSSPASSASGGWVAAFLGMRTFMLAEAIFAGQNGRPAPDEPSPLWAARLVPGDSGAQVFC